MGIWIRSQNKESLGFTNKIGYTDFGRFQRKGHFIVDADETNYAYLGEYPTKERAIEVLDEIQRNICHNTALLTVAELTECDMEGFVFQMPAE